MKYWMPPPPAGANPLVLTRRTHFVLPSISRGNRSGTSQMLSACPPENLLLNFQLSRLEDVKNCTSCPAAITIIHCPLSLCQNTLGSRKSGARAPMIGLALYFVQVRPRSVLYA